MIEKIKLYLPPTEGLKFEPKKIWRKRSDAFAHPEIVNGVRVAAYVQETKGSVSTVQWRY